ncbi:MAG: TonB-dependent receptor [Pirellulales bacterium]|nr:TonB-dependent receptor [Pirellulales bacterium]
MFHSTLRACLRAGARLGGRLAVVCAAVAATPGTRAADGLPEITYEVREREIANPAQRGAIRYERGKFALSQIGWAQLASFQQDVPPPGELPSRPPDVEGENPPAGGNQAENGAPQRPGDTAQPQTTDRAAPQQPDLSAPQQPDLSAPQQPGDITLATASAFTFNRDVGAAPADAPSGSPASQITSNTTDTVTSTALGEALSNNLEAVRVQRRSPVVLDPYVRGYRYGQLFTQIDGAFQFPVRTDLGNALMFVDSDLIQSATVVSGPYGVRYGPGLAFIDITRVAPPRYECGFESHLKLGGTYLDNGAQYRGRTTLYGGSANWGYSLSYGDRGGSDYRSGDSLEIPSSYHNKDVLAQFSFDTMPDQHVDFTYSRLDLSNAEFPAQVFDVNFLGSDSFLAQVVDEDPSAPWSRTALQGWYTRSRYYGDSLSDAKRRTNVVTRIEQATDGALGLPTGTALFQGFTNGGLTNTGGRWATTFGDPADWSLSFGPDFRYLQQGIGEYFLFTDRFSGQPLTPLSNFFGGSIGTALPQSVAIDPGMFCEFSVPVMESWLISAGARVDWYHTSVNETDAIVPPTPQTDLAQNDVLFAMYLTNTFKLSDALSLTAGGGQAQRAPTLLDRYGDALFYAVTQNGFDRFVGQPNADKERAWQIDLGLQANGENFRGALRGYQSWVLDYLTYSADTFSQPAGARVLFVTNTPLATLSGCEGFAEYDIGRNLTPFASLGYTYGVDQTIDQNLFGIPPFDSRIGARLHDSERGNTWGLECYARVVNNQDRIGLVRTEGVPNQFTAIEFPTPGFTVWNLRGYYNVSQNFNLFAGIDNLFDKNYIEHLNIRLTPDPVFGGMGAFNPGFFPYFGAQLTY